MSDIIDIIVPVTANPNGPQAQHRMKININGTLFYVPAYTSKTS